MSSQSDQFDDLPDALVSDLRATHGRLPAVSREMDAAVLDDARTGFARRRRFRLAARGAAVVCGLAAAVAVVAVVLPAVLRTNQPQQQANPVPPAGSRPSHLLMLAPAQPAEDADRDGKVDILDALVVAKLIEVRGAIGAAYDVDGDGKVDQSDVDHIAIAAVSVSDRPSGTRLQ